MNGGADLQPLWEAKEQGCERARAALIEQHRYLVPVTLARQFRVLPPVIDPQDMESEGLLALVKAVDRFDPARGVKFSSFAIRLIWGAMREWLRAEDWAPRSVRARERSGEAVTVLRVLSLETLLDPHGQEGAPDELALLDQLADPAPGPEEVALARIEQARAAAAVARLPAGWARVVEAKAAGLTFRHIGEQEGYSESNADRIYYRAIGWLRQRALDEEEQAMAAVGEWTRKEDERLGALLAEGKPWGRVAQWLKRPKGEVLARAAALGIEPAERVPLVLAAVPANGRAPLADPMGEEEEEEAQVPYVDQERAPRPYWPEVVRMEPVVPEDAELAVMADLVRQIQGLDDRARGRVMRWLMDRFGTWK